jgi:hypothetical protein
MQSIDLWRRCLPGARSGDECRLPIHLEIHETLADELRQGVSA